MKLLEYAEIIELDQFVETVKSKIKHIVCFIHSQAKYAIFTEFGVTFDDSGIFDLDDLADLCANTKDEHINAIISNNENRKTSITNVNELIKHCWGRHIILGPFDDPIALYAQWFDLAYYETDPKIDHLKNAVLNIQEDIKEGLLKKGSREHRDIQMLYLYAKNRLSLSRKDLFCIGGI
jgi:hypothetical protein